MPEPPRRDPWATLPANWRTTTTPPPPALPKLPPLPPIPQHERPLPELRLPATTCNPHCVRCQKAELRCLCDPPVLTCDHTLYPDDRPSATTRSNRTTKAGGDRRPERPTRVGTRLADVCLVRTRTHARLTDGRDGYQILVVPECPHCLGVHTHTTHPNAGPHRMSGCGQHYLLEIK